MQCNQHARDKAKAGVENCASNAKNDANGTENDASVGNDAKVVRKMMQAWKTKAMQAWKTMQKCGKMMQVRKTMQKRHGK